MSERVTVVGVDGGATRSFAIAATEDGQVLGASEAGSLNFFGSGLGEARRNLKQLLLGLRCRDEVRHTVVGCAALFGEATPKEKEMLCQGILPLEKTRVVSDAMTAHYGATLGGPGVAIIGGTGSIVLAKNEKGKTSQIGGWGHILGDPGSAYWIALESMKAAIASYEGTGPSTSLVNLVCCWFNVNSLPEILPTLHSPIYTKEKFSALARYLAQRVQPEDAVYERICQRAGEELGAQAVAATKAVGFATTPIPVYLLGGVVRNDETVRKSLVATMQKHAPVDVKMARLSPVLGATVLAMAAAGVTISLPFVEALSNSMENCPIEQRASS